MPAAYDFAIVGSGPLSALLAGILAHDHGKSVVRVSTPFSPQRLPRSLDIALALAARPQTWEVLRRSESETRSLLASIDGKEHISTTDVQVATDQPRTTILVAHLRHVAMGYGLSSSGDVFRRVPRLSGEIDLADSQVASVPAENVTISFAKTGAAEFSVAGEHKEIGQIVLADDTALLEHLPEEQRPQVLRVEALLATLTAPAHRLHAAVVLYPDRGVALMQRPDGAILAHVSGEADVEARLASTLTGPFPLARHETSRFQRMVSVDGAPLVGRLKPSKLFIAAGLGHAGAFLAPALARHLAGKSEGAEKRWFAAHDPSRSREAVAEILS